MESNGNVLMLQVSELFRLYKEKKGIDFLDSIVALQRRQQEHLELIDGKIDKLLMADYYAALAHIEHATLEKRKIDFVVHDLIKARDLFIRALSQSSGLTLKPAIRVNIAICAFTLGDTPLAKQEITKAKAELQEMVTHWTSNLSSENRILKLYEDRLSKKGLFDHILNQVTGTINEEEATRDRHEARLYSAKWKLEGYQKLQDELAQVEEMAR